MLDALHHLFFRCSEPNKIFLQFHLLVIETFNHCQASQDNEGWGEESGAELEIHEIYQEFAETPRFVVVLLSQDSFKVLKRGGPNQGESQGFQDLGLCGGELFVGVRGRSHPDNIEDFGRMGLVVFGGHPEAHYPDQFQVIERHTLLYGEVIIQVPDCQAESLLFESEVVVEIYEPVYQGSPHFGEYFLRLDWSSEFLVLARVYIILHAFFKELCLV